MNEHSKGNSKKDIDLINGCISKDPNSQELFFKKYYAFILGICLRYANDKDEARELLQEAYIKIYKSIQSFKFEGAFLGWMKRIVVNTAIDHFRKKVRQPDFYDSAEIADISVDPGIIENLMREDLLLCIRKLPQGYRTILNLYIIEGYSHKEISEKLGINEGTSKSQLFKAKKYLKRIIEEDLNN
jgi:RNA polymerase sigma factor (sigma-70 family)